MRLTFLEYFIPLVLAGLFSTVFIVASFLYYGLIGAGPAGVFSVLLGASAAIAGVSFLLGKLLFGEFDNPRAWTVVYTVLTVFASGWIPGGLLYTGHEAKVYVEQMATPARDFALSHFDELDVNHTGILTEETLKASAQDSRFGSEERELVQFLNSQIELAGHVISSYETTVPVTTIISCGSGCTIPIVNNVETTVYVYGISREDLPGFPAREEAKWSAW